MTRKTLVVTVIQCLLSNLVLHRTVGHFTSQLVPNERVSFQSISVSVIKAASPAPILLQDSALVVEWRPCTLGAQRKTSGFMGVICQANGATQILLYPFAITVMQVPSNEMQTRQNIQNGGNYMVTPFVIGAVHQIF